MSLRLNLIAACDAKMGIGLNNDLPWRLRKELAYFTRMTTGIETDSGSPDSDSGRKRNIVLMGRKTYESIPEKRRPLRDRLNVVLSRNPESLMPQKDLVLCKSWEDVVSFLNKPETKEDTGDVWVVGGSHIYELAIKSPHCHRIYLTKLAKEFECDTFFPQFDENKFKLIRDPNVPEEEQIENDIRYKFLVYEKSDAA